MRAVQVSAHLGVEVTSHYHDLCHVVVARGDASVLVLVQGQDLPSLRQHHDGPLAAGHQADGDVLLVEGGHQLRRRHRLLPAQVPELAPVQAPGVERVPRPEEGVEARGGDALRRGEPGADPAAALAALPGRRHRRRGGALLEAGALTELVVGVGAASPHRPGGEEEDGVVNSEGNLLAGLALEGLDRPRCQVGLFAPVSKPTSPTVTASVNLPGGGKEGRVELLQRHGSAEDSLLLEVLQDVRHGALMLVTEAQVEVGVGAPGVQVARVGWREV